MYFTEEIIREIISKNPIKGVVEKYTELKYIGKLLYGNCPFHQEVGSSFSIDLNSQTFFCFGCGVGGNVIDFVMKINDISFVEAVTILAGKAGVFLPEPNVINRENIQQKKHNLSKMNRVAAKFYEYELRKMINRNLSNPGMQYLYSRGLSLKTIQKFGLGYAGDFGDRLYNELLKAGFRKDEIMESGLVGYKDSSLSGADDYYDKFWNRIIFPIVNENNQCIGFGGRCLGDAKPKYLNSPETVIFNKGKNLYGLNVAKENASNGIILTEGYMDVIALHQAGFGNAVASLGTALTTSQAKLLKRYTDIVFLAYDGDIAGIKAATRAIPILSNAGIKTKIIKMPGAKDPDEYIKKFGSKKFEEKIKTAETSSRFLVQNSKEQYEQAIQILLNL